MWRSVCNGLVFFQSALPSEGSTLTKVSSSPPMSIHPSVQLCRICDVFPDNWNAFVTWECYASKTNLLLETPLMAEHFVANC